MILEYKSKIVITEMDKASAISTFLSVFAMTKIKIILKRNLKNIRARLKKAIDAHKTT